MADFTYTPIEVQGSAKAYRVKHNRKDVGTVLRGTAIVWHAIDRRGVRLTKKARTRIEAAERLAAEDRRDAAIWRQDARP